MAFGLRIDLRKKNKRNHIVDLFRRNTNLSKIQARILSGYSMNTILSIFDQLIEDGYIVESTGTQKPMGRKATFYSLNEKRSMYLGLTFNQSGIFSALMSFTFKPLVTRFTPLPMQITRQKFVEILTDHIKSIIKDEMFIQENCNAIGIAVPGDIDKQSGILCSYVLMPQLNGINFLEILKELFPSKKIFIEHNIRGMISYFLLERDLIEQHNTILYVSARSATACGLIHRGIVVTAHGEFGHVFVADDKKRCLCGRMGCLDSYFSLNGFMEFLQSSAAKEAGLYEDKPVLSLDVLEQAYVNGNSIVRAEMDMRLSRFACALLDAINLTVPDAVILSGELLKIYGDPISAINRIIEKEFHDSGYVAHFRRTKLIYKELGSEIAALGICRQMIEEDWGYLPPDECE